MFIIFCLLYKHFFLFVNKKAAKFSDKTSLAWKVPYAGGDLRMFSLTADYIMTDSSHWARAGHAELFESLTEWSSDVTDGVIVRTVSASHLGSRTQMGASSGWKSRNGRENLLRDD